MVVVSEFDGTGLSHIRDFFGEEKAKENERGVGTNSGTDERRGSSRNTSRLGLGAVPVKADSDPLGTGSDWTKTGKKRILSVGKRKHDDDSVEEENVEEVDDDEDEDEGRTSAVVERKGQRKPPPSIESAVSANASAAFDTGSKSHVKKKKKGKKERQAEREGDFGTTIGIGDSTAPQADSNEEKNDTVTSSKRKRKKIRSRQKNIYKDTRSTQNKPAYLIRGRSEYAGRPLTKETREKVDVPDTRMNVKGQGKETFGTSSTTRNNLPDGFLSREHDSLAGVAYDKSLCDVGVATSKDTGDISGEPREVPVEKNKTSLVKTKKNGLTVKKRKKKSKFKNV